jgi:hypothetical protein
LEKDFESLVRKVGLSRTDPEVDESVPLPAWVQSIGLCAAQVFNICGAAASEGSPVFVAAPTKMVVSPAIIEAGTNTEGAVAGGTAGRIAVAGGGSGCSCRSPFVP